MQTIIYTNGEHPDFVFLCQQLNNNLKEIFLNAAIHLYLKTGYSIIENYGQYKDTPESVCLQKNLNQHAV